MIIPEVAGGHVLVHRAQRRPQRLQPNAVGTELHGVGLDTDGGTGTAADKALANPRYLGDLLLQYRVGGIVDLRPAQLIRGECQNHDRRVGRVGLKETWVLRQVGGQLRTRRVDGSLHVTRGAIDVAVEVELQGDIAATERARRGHLRDAGDASELALQGCCNGRGGGLRAGAGQLCLHIDGGELNLRQRRDGKQGVAHGAAQQQRQAQQRSRDRTANEGS